MTTSRRTTLAVSAAGLLALACTVAVPQLAHRISPAFDVIAGASRPWLFATALGFLAAFACTVGAWRAALASAGGHLCPKQAAARLAIGAMVNAFAPAKLGDAVKIGLCSRALDTPGRIWTTSGAYAALAATRGLTLAALVVLASVTGALPLWPVFVLIGGAGAVAVAAALSTRLRSHRRIAQALTGLVALYRSPRALAAVVAWTIGMQVARVAATAAAAAALALPHPLLAALVILSALDLAGTLPLTPGGFGVGSGAVALALSSRGIGMGQALAVGLAIQGVETVVSVTTGTVGLAYLFQPTPRVRRLVAGFAVVGASGALAALLGLTLLDLF
ncbi:MAG TPA: lysylphosphatidylglycerol synthase domain-containing protein [Gaiellaceae bacterium]|nr:lysylphosphatidylglycerol synthase domain-containing protein [Gaiellaceae bacterium]